MGAVSGTGVNMTVTSKLALKAAFPREGATGRRGMRWRCGRGMPMHDPVTGDIYWRRLRAS